MEIDPKQVTASIAKMPSTDRMAAMKDVLNLATPEEKKELRQVIIAMDKPSAKARDKLWLIVIWGFVVVMVGSFLTLAASVFIAPPDKATSGQLILTVFTSVIGFLAGLFAPSPVAKSGEENG